MGSSYIVQGEAKTLKVAIQIMLANSMHALHPRECTVPHSIFSKRTLGSVDTIHTTKQKIHATSNEEQTRMIPGLSNT